MYLLEYFCIHCGTTFYAEERQGELQSCPYCKEDMVKKTNKELKGEIVEE